MLMCYTLLSGASFVPLSESDLTRKHQIQPYIPLTNPRTVFHSGTNLHHQPLSKIPRLRAHPSILPPPSHGLNTLLIPHRRHRIPNDRSCAVPFPRPGTARCLPGGNDLQRARAFEVLEGMFGGCSGACGWLWRMDHVLQVRLLPIP